MPSRPHDAGWRGLAAGVPQVAVRALATNFGARARDLIVAVGPSISAASYEVGAEVRDRFAAAGFGGSLPEWFPSATRPGHWLFDGWRSARDQLVGAGVDGADIHVSRLCTFTNTELCCSYRRDEAPCRTDGRRDPDAALLKLGIQNSEFRIPNSFHDRVVHRGVREAIGVRVHLAPDVFRR